MYKTSALNVPSTCLRAATTALLALALLTAPAHAQSSESPDVAAEADAAFTAGRELFEEGRFLEACQKFELSMSLDPSPGTLLNLGNCYEPQGHLLRALDTFERALADAQKSQDPRRQQIWSAAARERIAALSARIPVLALEGIDPSWHVVLDGKPVDKPSEPVRLDPGRHELRVSAPGKQTFSRDFEIATGRRLDLHLPGLEDEPDTDTASGNALDAPPAASATPTSRFGIWPWVAGGAGAALVGTSLITGAMASSKASRLEKECAGKVCLDASLAGVRDDASTLALTTDVLWITGAVALGVGVTLFVLDQPESEASATVAAGCFAGACGLEASGRF